MDESEGKEAEQVPPSVRNPDSASASDQDDFVEPASEEIKNAVLVATDTFVDINYDDLVNEDYDSHPSGVIHAIVRSGSQDEHSSSEHNDTSTGEESSEDHNEIPKDLSAALNEVVLKESDPIEEIEEDEYGKGSKWQLEKKHIFILSSSGKPIYSRHGQEDKLVTIMGVLQALISFVSAAKDSVRSIVAGDHKFVFLVREHIYLVAVSKGLESVQQLVLQLSYIYNQILSVLTFTSLQKIFKQRRNYDLRRMLSGSEKFIDNLLNLMDHDPSFKLQAVRCLPLDSPVRDSIAQSIIQHARVKDLVFAIILANNQLVTLVRMKKYFLHPMDLHLIINLVNASESFKAAESWTPICLPKFDAR
ncbi:vacuolar fusion protein MON1 [Mytilus galloprovincialis]|uniref:Vacuolar fusion protein MON1 homolog n=2 Tax=Mytilus galloprovincialis TaxID=29158 RepID=A0A8B6F8B3_MYTGA|nr:vacuolar fusion protein MON1 [Mytilus galloprovincialis]